MDYLRIDFHSDVDARRLRLLGNAQSIVEQDLRILYLQSYGSRCWLLIHELF